jgi:Cu(I)/Ag(I) efflux system membrane fusion protein
MDLIPVEHDEESGDVEGDRRLSVSEAGKKLMEISTTPAQRKSIDIDVRMVGKITYDESRVAEISAWVPGRLDKLFVDYTGYVVERGDPLAELYSPQLLAAQEELLQSVNAEREAGEMGSSSHEIASRTLEAVRERLALWGLSPEQIGEIEERGTSLPHVTIRAPAGGTVIEKNATEGMYVTTGSTIYTIADLSEVWLELEAYETDLPLVQNAREVRFWVEAFPHESFSGKVSFVDPIVDAKTRTIKIRANVDNRAGKLKPDMFARAVVRSRPSADGKRPPLVIPATAALVTGTRAVVYVEVEGAERPTYEGREVVLGPRVGDHYVVASGISEGERVVTEGSFKIDSALQIRAKASMMSPTGAEQPAVPQHTH